MKSKTREWKAAYMREWRKKNPERFAEHRRRYNEKHRTELLKFARNYRSMHKEQTQAVMRAWMNVNRDRQREMNRLSQRRAVATLADRYLRGLLAGKNLKPRDIPEPLVEAYRDYLKLKRLCQKSQTYTN